jgi:KDO2-lipid IV(A) lauroyltransferase
MKAAPSSSTPIAPDPVEMVRVEKVLGDTSSEDLLGSFSEAELREADKGPDRGARLTAWHAAKEACCKLFPRETALGTIAPADFSIRPDEQGVPQVAVTPNAQAVLDRHRFSRLRISLAHTSTTATAEASADPRHTEVPWFGRVLYCLLPFRRRLVLENLRRVFGETLPESEICRLAQAYYAHFARFFIEFIRLPWMSDAKRKSWIRVENMESPTRAHEQGKGVLLLTGHFGNWEVATVAAISEFPQFKGLFHFLRRPLKPWLLNEFVTWRFKRAGFGTLAKRGSLEAILDLLAAGAIVVYVFDQHSVGREGVVVDFFGHPSGTSKSTAILAMSTGAAVVPTSSWREPDGTHVVRFEDPVPTIECENTNEAIRLNTLAYNVAIERMLLRHPEQWIWMHRRWKIRV